MIGLRKSTPEAAVVSVGGGGLSYWKATHLPVPKSARSAILLRSIIFMPFQLFFAANLFPNLLPAMELAPSSSEASMLLYRI